MAPCNDLKVFWYLRKLLKHKKAVKNKSKSMIFFQFDFFLQNSQQFETKWCNLYWVRFNKSPLLGGFKLLKVWEKKFKMTQMHCFAIRKKIFRKPAVKFDLQPPFAYCKLVTQPTQTSTTISSGSRKFHNLEEINTYIYIRIPCGSRNQFQVHKWGLWVKFLKCGIYFHSFFWGSNCNKFDDDNFYSYNFHGEKFNGKFHFSKKKKYFNIFAMDFVQFNFVSHTFNSFKHNGTYKMHFLFSQTHQFKYLEITSDQFPIKHEDLSCFSHKTTYEKCIEIIWNYNSNLFYNTVKGIDEFRKVNFDAMKNMEQHNYSTRFFENQPCKEYYEIILWKAGILTGLGTSILLIGLSQILIFQNQAKPLAWAYQQTSTQRYKYWIKLKENDCNPTSKILKKKSNSLVGEREGEKLMYEILRSWFMVIIKVFSHMLYSRTRNLNYLRSHVVKFVQLNSAEIWCS
ncbi:hypothetical protein VP01_173g3 [Puccinia sorghi]|uniref:Uncharacterized protein n=1 Tax=Puccinia sorghi TaxID=27349 RepID=A0A0L6VH25_9BASI|nr:hypothetical protein VP01_173g3 [Puccinia sorghi]